MAENRRLVSVSPISADNLPQSIDELVQISNTNFDNDGCLGIDANYDSIINFSISSGFVRRCVEQTNQ
jgi:hypothetical protein